MVTISSPHDRIFKSSLSDIRVARDFFKQHLPAEIMKFIDLEVLELCPQSYIDTELKLMQSDILYKTTIEGKSTYLYLLLEHQSKPDKFMPLRMLKYQLAIWDEYIKNDKDGKLPLIIGMVFYNGIGPYTYSCDIKDLFNAPVDLIQAIWSKPFILIDAHTIPDDNIKDYLWSGVLAFFMKNIYQREFIPYLEQIMSYLKQIEEQGGSNYTISLLHYVLNAGKAKSAEQIVETIKNHLSIQTGETIMVTILDQLLAQLSKERKHEGWQKEVQERALKKIMQENLKKGIQEGKQEAWQQGVQQGEVMILLRQLKRKFTTIPQRYVSLIKHAKQETLLEWSDRIIDAQSLADIFKH